MDGLSTKTTLFGEFASSECEKLFLSASYKPNFDGARLCIIATSITCIAFIPMDIVMMSGERLALFLADRVLIAAIMIATLLVLSMATTTSKVVLVTHIHQYVFFSLNALVFNHPLLERHGGMFFPLIAMTLFLNLPGSFRRVAVLCAFAPGISLVFWGILRPVPETPSDLAAIVLMTVIAFGVGGVARSQNGRLRREDYLRMERERQANQALLEAKEAAEAGVVAKARFLAVMSHEIRTPMNGILGLSRLLLDRPMASEDRERLEMVHHSAEALLIILDDILDISKLESGQLDFEAAPFHLRHAVGGVVALLKTRADEKGLFLDVEISPDLPIWVKGDASRLRQILLNLIGNAVKFTGTGGVVVRVEPASTPGDIAVSIADTGIGMDDEHKHRLFQVFSQADASISRRFGGTGLGLAICKKLVEAQGGVIGVESAAGAGSTFWFRLPFAAAEEPAVEPGRPRSSVCLPRLAVLLAEDNLVNQKVALGFLGRDGHRVTIAHNGIEAVEFAGRGGFDLVLMDMQMPEMDGLEAARRIRALPSPEGKVPIIALTANAMRRDGDRCIAAGMDAHVAKPVDPDVLFAAMARVLGAEVPAAAEPAAAGFALDEVADFLGRDGLVDLIQVFATQAGQVCNGLRQSQDDPVLVRELAHDLKGMAGSAGCLSLAALASDIEAAAKTSRIEDARRRIEGLAEAWGAAKDALAARFALAISDDGAVIDLMADEAVG